MSPSMPTALTIAGTDPTGGAGIQADLKSFQEREVYGMSVVTSVVAQNTTGVTSVEHLPVPFIRQQLECVFSDIPPNVVKTGMIAASDMMQVVADVLASHAVPYVLDPVMVATSGDPLINANAREVMRERLIPLATIVTPNIKEAEALLSMPIQSQDDMALAAKRLVQEMGAETAIVKGGHLHEEAVDVLFDGSEIHRFSSERIETNHTHGTGCTFSAVIAAELAKGHSIYDSVQLAKQFITDAIRFSLELGKGNGPTNQWAYRLKRVPNIL